MPSPPDRRWLYSLLLVLLAGCASTPPATQVDVGRWQLGGRIALWSGEQKDSASLDWIQCGAHFDIRLRGPLGVGGGRLWGVPGEVLLQRPGHADETDTSAERLMARLGWPAPVASLGWWVRGLPAPGERLSVDMDAEGRILGLQQSGWSLVFSDHVRAGESWRPQKIDARQGEVRVRLLARQFNDNPPACR